VSIRRKRQEIQEMSERLEAERKSLDRLEDEFDQEGSAVQGFDNRVADMARREERFIELMEEVERSIVEQKDTGSGFVASSDGLTVEAELGSSDFGAFDPVIWGLASADGNLVESEG
jgi:uncharacterized protein YukE